MTARQREEIRIHYEMVCIQCGNRQATAATEAPSYDGTCPDCGAFGALRDEGTITADDRRAVERAIGGRYIPGAH